MLLFSAGFFAAHSVASSWIGPRAKRAKGQASSLYLFSYYLGSSIAGTLGGVFWHNYGWNGVGAFIALMLVIALLVGTRLHRRLHARPDLLPAQTNVNSHPKIDEAPANSRSASSVIRIISTQINGFILLCVIYY